jgi:hypothetical protein
MRGLPKMVYAFAPSELTMPPDPKLDFFLMFFVAGVVLLIWGDILANRILKQVNAGLPKRAHFSPLAMRLEPRAVIEQHARLYPDSKLRQRRRWVSSLAVVLVVTALIIFMSEGLRRTSV